MANLTRVDQSLMTDFVTYSTIIAANNYLFGGSVNCIISQASSSVAANGPAKAFQLNALTGVTSVACYIQGSNDNVNWLNIGLISLSAPGTDGFFYFYSIL